MNLEDIQLSPTKTAEKPNSLCKWGHFERAKTNLKKLLDTWSAHVREHPGSNYSKSLMAGNFAAHWPTDPSIEWSKHFKEVY